MDRQDIFNRVAKHLLTQNKKARVEDKESGTGFSCVYITKEGLRCAIGCLIPDAHPALESTVIVSALFREYPDLADLWKIPHALEVDKIQERNRCSSFLRRLQGIHDGFEPTSWKECLRDFGRQQDLNVDVLAEVK